MGYSSPVLKSSIWQLSPFWFRNCVYFVNNNLFFWFCDKIWNIIHWRRSLVETNINQVKIKNKQHLILFFHSQKHLMHHFWSLLCDSWVHFGLGTTVAYVYFVHNNLLFWSCDKNNHFVKLDFFSQTTHWKPFLIHTQCNILCHIFGPGWGVSSN